MCSVAETVPANTVQLKNCETINAENLWVVQFFLYHLFVLRLKE